MKRLFTLMCALLSMNALMAGEVIQCPLTFPNQMDFEQYWDLKAELGNEEERIMDWAPLNQELENSRESFTVQTYQFDKDFDLKMMYKKFVSTLKENLEDPSLLHTKVHSKGRKAIYFEWWVSPPSQEAQHEWIKLMKNKDNQLAIVRFVTREELPQNEEFLWVECVADSKFDFGNEVSFLDKQSEKRQVL